MTLSYYAIFDKPYLKLVSAFIHLHIRKKNNTALCASSRTVNSHSNGSICIENLTLIFRCIMLKGTKRPACDKVIE